MATIIPITSVPSGNKRNEIQKNVNLLRPFLSAALPISKLMEMAAPKNKATVNSEIGSMCGVYRAWASEGCEC